MDFLCENGAAQIDPFGKLVLLKTVKALMKWHFQQDLHCLDKSCRPKHIWASTQDFGTLTYHAWVKVFRIIPDFRMLRLTFRRNIRNLAYYNSFSDIFTAYLKSTNNLSLKY